jgi:hypothetical protein
MDKVPIPAHGATEAPRTSALRRRSRLPQRGTTRPGTTGSHAGVV